MPTNSKKTIKKPASGKKTVVPVPATPWRRMVRRIREYLQRRPHRSFRRTRRRDYVRSLRLPGYWAFTSEVWRALVARKKLFLSVALLYAVLTSFLIGFASQNSYSVLSETLRETGSQLFTGGWGEIGKASLLLATGATGSLNDPLTEAQQIYAVIIVLLVWLTTVWLHRSYMAGARPKLRDALYNAGAPIVSTFIVLFVGVLQLLPVALAAAGLGAAIASGLLSAGGVEAMLFWAAIAGLLLLSLYWLTSTLIALVVVALPGMYPMNALRIAGDMVVGRRLRILLRMLWMALITLIVWLLVMVPVIVFDAWIKGIFVTISWLPIVPVFLMITTSLSVVWMASYVYLFYRKVVDDDAAPA